MTESTRRSFLLGATAALALGRTRAAAPRPNILFAIADDATHASAYGHRWLNTPHFDRVAREGALFRQFFVNNPKCAPSRACTLTGRHTWQLGEAANHFSYWPRDLTVYPDLLAEAGYLVGYTGKPWGPGDWKRCGRTENPVGPAWHGRTLTPPARGISNKDYAANFRDFLAARQPDQPFCFWYGGHEPHRTYEAGAGVRAGKRLADVTVPGYWPDDEIVRSDMLDYALEIEWFDEHLGRMLDMLEETGQAANTLVVVTSDNGAPFPRVKGQIFEDDCHLPLAVRWPAVCPPGRTIDDLVSCIDFAPTFLEAAGLPAPETMAGRSLLPLLRSERSGHLDPTRDAVFLGRERHDLGREGDLGYPVRAIRTADWFYAVNYAPERWPAGNPETGFTNIDSSPTKSRILELRERGETRWFELAMGKRPAEELYRVSDDPECLRNLAGEPALAEVKQRLRARLEQTLRETGDPRLLGRGDEFEAYEYVGAANAPHSWRALQEGRFKGQSY